MGNNEYIIARLLELNPIILEKHFNSIVNKSAEHQQFIERHKSVLKSSFDIISNDLVNSLFLTPIQYPDRLKLMASKGYQEGVFTSKQLGQGVSFIMELSEHLHITFQTAMLEKMDELVEDHVLRLCLRQRLIECDWVRFIGFVNGFLATKDQQINHLHIQKLSVMGQMAAGMAHEIRNPMASIKGFAQLAKRKLQSGNLNIDELIQYLDHSILEIDSINGLVSNFLLLARKNETLDVEQTRISVMEMVERISAVAKQLMIENHIELVIQMPEKKVHVNGVASQLEQVLLNLIKNSIDALSEGGMIRLVVETDELTQIVIISIIDNGMGVDSDIINKIFDPFFTTKELGTGIGLAICKEIIESHNGSIEVTSEPRIGTTVRISLEKS
jgi:signal transduction histidine kinase